MGKLTTVELDDDVVEYINLSIKKGKFRHLKEFVNYCLKVATIYTIDEWDVSKGMFYIHPCRVTLIPSDALLVLMKYIPEGSIREAVEAITSCLKPRLRFFRLSPRNPEHLPKILELLTLHGLGRFALNDSETIEVAYAVLPVEVVKELLEAILEVKLEVLETTKVAYIFRIVK
ncbi:MAG: hypothetical protein NDF52_07030 [archaeon YNP-WB-062]|jgi:hypothetical protein|nr:hypothetical protein [Candidatus Culexarchaeum yellowstonense]